MKFFRNIFLYLLITFLIYYFYNSESFAQQKKTIGIILPSNVPYYEEVHTHVLKRLEENIISGNMDLLIQKPYPDPIALSNAARKLIALNVDIIICYGTEAALAAIREKPQQPIIYIGGYNPVLERYRANNITGVEFKTPISSITRYLNSMKDIKTIGIVYNPLESDSVYQLNEFLKCCPFYKITVIKIPIKTASELKKVIPENKVDALIFTTSSIANIALSGLSNIGIPVATLLPRKDARPIISLYPSAKKQAEKAGNIIQKILKGKNPSEVPRDLSADMELIFNLADAYNMNLRIPADLLTEATEVLY